MGVGARVDLRSPWWYGVAAASMGGGLTLAGVVLLLGYAHFAGSIAAMDRCQVPGATTVTLRDPGDYVIFYEAPGAGPADIRALTVALTGPDARVEPPAGESGYSVGSVTAVAVERVTVARGGAYQLRAGGGRGGQQARVAIGRDPLKPFYRTALLALVLGATPFLLGLGISAVTYVERRRLRSGTIIPAQ